MFSFPISEKEIIELNKESINKLIILDSNGLILGPEENLNEYKTRLSTIKHEAESLYTEINNEQQDGMLSSVKLKPSDIIEEAEFQKVETITEQYSFSVKWAPGFYSKKSVGFLAGAATLISETGLPVFILSSKFKHKTKWLLYTKEELLAHELSHVARTPLNDKPYEEFFAYKLSKSRFRKYLGSFFHSPVDPVIMLLPFLILLAVTLINFSFNTGMDEVYFWISAFIYPAFLFIRNSYYKHYYKKACNALEKITETNNIDSILFRCTAKEIKTFSRYSKTAAENIRSLVDSFSENNIRWKIIRKRFIYE